MRHFVLAAISCVFAVSTAAHADPTAAAAGHHKHLVRLYKPTLLTNPDTQFPFSATELNNRAEIAGSTIVPGGFFLYHAAKWKNGQATFLPELPNTNSSTAVAANDHGDFVGVNVVQSSAGDDGPHAVLWHDGTVMDIGRPAGTTGFNPIGMNNRREVIGVGSDLNGYVWSEGTFAQLAIAPNARNPFPEAINNVGSVVGGEVIPASSMTSQAALWRDGGVELLGVLPGMQNSRAEGLNDFDHVVGVSFGSTEQAFIWRRGTMTALPPVVAGDETTAWAINDWDQVVGSETSASDREMFPVMWENGHAIRLNDLIRPEDKAQMDPEFVLRSAYSINEWGQILVYASPVDPNRTGDSYYLLTPVFEWQ